MLELCERLAARMRPHAWFVTLLGVAAAIGLPAAILLVSGPTGQWLSLTAITLLLWALTLGAFIQAFGVPLPRHEAGAGLLTRIRTRVARGYRWCLVVLIGALLMLVAWFSLRAALLIADERASQALVRRAESPLAPVLEPRNTRIPRYR